MLDIPLLMNANRFGKRVAAVLLCLGVLAVPGLAVEIPHGRVTLHLQNALIGPAGEDSSAPRRVADLVLHTHFDAQGWAPVVGMAPDFNRAHHRGRVQRMRVLDDAVHLEVVIRIAGDPWVPGGAAAYHIVVPISDDDPWHGDIHQGSYTGRFDVHGVNGGVAITLKPGHRLAADLEHEQTAAHPRLWFRQQDLGDLRRRKEQSPVLAAAYETMEQADSILSLGLMYHLTGERSYAQRARVKIQGRMDERGDGIGNRGLVWGQRLREVANAYDLFSGHWDDAFDASVLAYLDWIGQRLLHRPHTVSRTLKWSANNEYQAYLRGAAALAALILHGKEGPEPQAPRPLGEQPRTITQDPALSPYFTEHDGQRFRSDWLPQRWWIAGPLPDPHNTQEDFFAHMGGSGQFHQSFSGEEKVRYQGAQALFEPLDQKYFWEHQGRSNIELTDLYARHYQRKEDGYFHTGYFYTVLDVREEQLVRYVDHPGGARLHAWINGRRLHADDYLRLQEGRHIVLVRAFIHRTSSWGKMWMSPRFIEATEDAMREDIRRRQAEYEMRYADYEEDRAYFDQQNGSNPAWRHMSAISQIHMDDYYRHALGSGGWALGGTDGLHLPMEYNTAFGQVYGHGVSGEDDIEVMVVRQLYQMVFADDHVDHARLDSSQAVQAGHIARAWPRIPDAYKPAVLWLWDRLLLSQGERIRFKDSDEAFFTYLHYPLGMQSRHPHDVLASPWHAKGSGGVIFRNGFRGPEHDIIVQTLARQQGEGNNPRPNAGALSVWAYGHEWAARPHQSSPHREHESVVHLPGLEHNRDMRGQVQELRSDPFGGMVTMDLSLIYAGTRTRNDRHGRERPHALVDNLLQLRTEHIADIGLRGGRSVAVDYSGLSGAPALWVVVDDIAGGRNQAKRWHWNIPAKITDIDAPQLDIDGNAFQLQQGDALMRATLLHPQRVRLQAVLNHEQDIPGQREAATLHGIQARGRRGDEGRFIAVFTLGKEDPPSVQTLHDDDDGLRIQVGDQEIFIDGFDVRFLSPSQDEEES